MRFTITITGVSPLLTHNVITGLDTTSPANQEKNQLARKRGSNRTQADLERLRTLDCYASIWTTEVGDIGIPCRALRSMIEESAKTLRQGPQVRQGLLVMASAFAYDQVRYGTTIDELAATTQFTVPVKVKTATIERTRAKFDPPWSCTFEVSAAEELVDQSQLHNWLFIGGQRIGLGDWRPAKSGIYGRFIVESIGVLPD